ncbi:MAG TPA: flagellar hook-associated protein 3 [Oxalobacteraceae bacterium]|nr:flagellar hook-associated protein 3 [Oxalobacteraceae bacterium]
MRISTNTLFETGSARLSDLQARLSKTQVQLSTGRRILTPADDPVAASQALDLTQAQGVNLQFATNRQSAKSSLNQEESTLASATSLLQDTKTLVIQAGNAVLSNSDRASIATDLSGRLDDLIALSNARDGTGSYLFSGYQTATTAFTKTPTGAQYQGDQGQRFAQVDTSRQIALGDAGNTVFEQNKTIVTATGVHTGTGTISVGAVVDATALTGDSYSVNFTDPATYDVVDTTTNATLSSGNAYTSGQSVTFAGLSFDINGSPAAGDTFTAKPSNNQSIFKALSDLITQLQTPGTAGLSAGLAAANGNIDQGLDNVLTVRASVGSRLKELDSLDSAGADRNVQYAQTLSQLQDLDYTKAITDLTQQQTILTAAQQSFAKIAGLSLFNYLN